MFDRFSRRQFIKLTGGFAAGTAAAGSLPLINLLRANAQNSTGYKVIGYFCNWAQYREAGGKFLPEQIDPSLFTHINFAFGLFGFVTWSVDPSETRAGEQRYTGDYTVQPVEWNDQTVLYPAIQSLKQKNPNLKTLLSIGGWSFNSCDDTPESAGTKYPFGPFTCQLFSKMAADPGSRTQFIKSAIDYAKQYGFDGIDLDWEYPADSKRGGQDADYDNYLALLQEFRQTAGQDFLITVASAAVPKGSKTGDSFFQWMAECGQYLDWFNVMSYDYHGAFDDPNTIGTGANAPLLQDSVPNGTFDIKDTVESYLKANIPKEKIVLGMPTYGRSYVVADRTDGFGKPFSSAGPAGPATATPGVLAYYEILEKMANGELDIQKWDDATLTPYAYSTKTGLWVSYDDPKSLGYKVSYLIEKQLAGAMVWAIDLDNFNKTQSSLPEAGKSFPLMNTIKGILDNPGIRPVLKLENNAVDHDAPVDTGTPVGDENFGEPAVYDTGTAPSIGLNSGNRVVEVHKNASNDALYYHVGKVADNKIAFGPSQKYDTGVQSSVAIADNGVVIEVHKSQHQDTLWFLYGRIGESSDNDKIGFFRNSQKYDTGTQPSVAISNNASFIVEVHKSEGDNTLLYHIGKFNRETIDWGKSQRYAEGLSPSVAVTNDGLVVAVHQSKESEGSKLRYLVGKVNGDRIDWGPISEYETGSRPSVAINNDGLVVAVHQSEFFDTVWYRGVGQVKDNAINWRNEKSQQYSEGREPRVACNGESVVAAHTDGSNLFYSVLTIPSIRSNWIELRGANSYLYCVCNSAGDDKQRRAASSHTMKVEAGAPYLYAVLTKDENSVDFPTGVVLTITAPDGTKYEGNVQQENLLVIMSGASLRCLIVKDPKPGDWQMSMTAPEGASFHCQCNTVPSKDPYTTITNTFSTPNGLVKRSVDKGTDVTGWLGPALAINATATAIGAEIGAAVGSAVPGAGTLIGGLLGATVGLAVGNITTALTLLTSPTPTIETATTLTQSAQISASLTPSPPNYQPRTVRVATLAHTARIPDDGGYPAAPRLVVPNNWRINFTARDNDVTNAIDYAAVMGSFHRNDIDFIDQMFIRETALGGTVINNYRMQGQTQFPGEQNPTPPFGVYRAGETEAFMPIVEPSRETLPQETSLVNLMQGIIRTLNIHADDTVILYFLGCRTCGG